MNDPVGGGSLRLEQVVEAGFDQRAMAVEELAVHVDGLVERVAPRLGQEAHQRKVAAQRFRSKASPRWASLRGLSPFCEEQAQISEHRGRLAFPTDGEARTFESGG